MDLIRIGNLPVFAGVRTPDGRSAGPIGVANLIILIGMALSGRRSAGPFGATNLLVFIGRSPLEGASSGPVGMTDLIPKGKDIIGGGLCAPHSLIFIRLARSGGLPAGPRSMTNPPICIAMAPLGRPIC